MKNINSISILLFCIIVTLSQAKNVTHCVEYKDHSCIKCAFGYDLDFTVDGCFLPCPIQDVLYQGNCTPASNYNAGCEIAVIQAPSGQFQCFGCVGEYILYPVGNSQLCIPLSLYLSLNKTAYCNPGGICYSPNVTNCVNYIGNQCIQCAFGYQLDFGANGCFLPCPVQYVLYNGNCTLASSINPGCVVAVIQAPSGQFQCFGCSGEYVTAPSGLSLLCTPLSNYLQQNSGTLCSSGGVCYSQNITNCVAYSNNKCTQCTFGYILDPSVSNCFLPCAIQDVLYNGTCTPASNYNAGCGVAVVQYPSGQFQCLGCTAQYVLISSSNTQLCTPLSNYIQLQKVRYCATICAN